MPGRRLSSVETSLLEFWREPPAAFPQALLKGVTIEGPPSLRGISNLQIRFDYPLTAICGRNGVGKSSILAVTAFSAGRPGDWVTGPRPIARVRRMPRRMNFAWDEFFFHRRQDPPLDGLKIHFDYTIEGNDLRVSRLRRPRGHWKTLPDPGRSRTPTLPARPIDFLSLSRILPPGELRDVRKGFVTGAGERLQRLSESARAAMSAILGREYEDVEVRTHRGANLAQCTAGASYNGFDMGSGESSAIAILSALERLPVGGLLLIEEVEHGFHPEAQFRLIEALTDQVMKKKQQIIFTTHSEYILDHLPKVARVLVERHSVDSHRSHHAPTTRQAMYAMVGDARPELTIYVEDDFARAVVRGCLDGETRRRVRVVPIGDGARVVEQLAVHQRAGFDGHALSVLDGDSLQHTVRQWARSAGLPENDPRIICLPGNTLPPELWVLEALQIDECLDQLVETTRLDRGELMSQLDELSNLSDPHDLPLQFGRRNSMENENSLFALTTAAGLHPELDIIRSAVRACLDISNQS